MDISDWWSKLDADTKDWLVDHNGEPLTPAILDRIIAAGGSADIAAATASDDVAEGVQLSDAAIDWIEAAANDEAD